MNETPLPLVCFTKDALNISEFLASLRKRQIAWMSEAQINGIPVVRACVTSFKTTERDVRWVVSEMNRLVAQDRGVAVNHCGALRSFLYLRKAVQADGLA